MTQQQTSEIINQARNGSRAAQHAIFVEYKPLVLRIVYRVLGPWPKPDIEDTIQQVYIELFRSLNSFKGESSFETWIYRIGTAVCLQKIRSKYRKKKQMQQTMEPQYIQELPDVHAQTDLRIERKELLDLLYSALDKISQQRRLVFVLFEIEGKTIEDISQVLQIPAATVKTRLFRARQDLSKKFDRNHLVPAPAITRGMAVESGSYG